MARDATYLAPSPYLPPVRICMYVFVSGKYSRTTQLKYIRCVQGFFVLKRSERTSPGWQCYVRDGNAYLRDWTLGRHGPGNGNVRAFTYVRMQGKNDGDFLEQSQRLCGRSSAAWCCSIAGSTVRGRVEVMLVRTFVWLPRKDEARRDPGD